MSITTDQLFEQQTAGQADWDSGLAANFTILERGFHVVTRAGMAVKTGDVLWVTSGDYFVKFDTNSQDIEPRAISPFAASSGDTLQALTWGVMRSMDVFSASVSGQLLFVSAATPGAVVRSYSGASRPIGFGIGTSGVVFNPRPQSPEQLTRVYTVAATKGAANLFSLDGGKYGWVRELRVTGNSADLVEIKFFSGSARVSSERLYETKSGGVTVVGSFLDRAGWPYENTTASSLSGLIYGSVTVLSAAAVGSDSLTVRAFFDRFR